MAHKIEDIHWRRVGGWARVYFTLDGLPAIMYPEQKRPILEAGVVSIHPHWWSDRLEDVTLRQGESPGVDGAALFTCGLRSLELAQSVIDLNDAMEAGTVETDPRYRGDFDEASETAIFMMRP